MRLSRNILLLSAALVLAGCVASGIETRKDEPQPMPANRVEIGQGLARPAQPSPDGTGEPARPSAPADRTGSKLPQDAAIDTIVAAWMIQLDESPAEALKIYPVVKKAFPDKWEVHYNGGILYMRLKQYDDAEDAFGKAARLKAPPEKIYNALGILYYETGRKSEAAEALKKAFGYNWKSQALINIGNVYLDMGKYDEATGYYRDAEAMDPQNPMLHYNKGILLYRKGNYKKALDEFEKVPGAEDDARLAFCKAQSLLKTARYEESVKLLRKIAEKGANNFYLYKHIGIIYEIYLGNPEKAFESYTAYLSHFKDDKEVQAWQDITRTKIMNKEMK